MKTSLKTPKSRLILATLAAAAAVGLASRAVLSQAAPGRGEDGPPNRVQPGAPDGRGEPRPGRGQPFEPPPPAPRPDPVSLTGSVLGYNFGPGGNIDALMIKAADRTIQVNLPPPLAPFAAQQAGVGSQVKITAFPELGMPDHPIYELTSLTTEQGRELKLAAREDRKFIHEEAAVTSLNYARRGEVDGVVLDNGDFVHIGPSAAGLKLAVGQKLTIDGVGHPMLTSEHHAIEAIAIDGKMLEQPPRPGAQAGPRPGGPGNGPPRADRRGRDGDTGPDRRRGGPNGIDGPDGPDPRFGREQGPQRDGPDGPAGGPGRPRTTNGRPPVDGGHGDRLPPPPPPGGEGSDDEAVPPID